MIGFRTALISDLDFIVEAIIESEKSRTEILSWSRILQISEPEVQNLIRNVIHEEIEDQEWHLPNFLIAEYDGKPAAALSCWVEGSSGIPSGVLKAQAIAWFVPELWKAAESALRLVASVQIPRKNNALQLENIYTRPAFRGKGIIRELIGFALEKSAQENPEVTLAEIQLMGNNTAALHTYTQCGFLKQHESTVSDGTILTLLPGNTRVSLIANINHGNS